MFLFLDNTERDRETDTHTQNLKLEFARWKSWSRKQEGGLNGACPASVTLFHCRFPWQGSALPPLRGHNTLRQNCAPMCSLHCTLYTLCWTLVVTTPCTMHTTHCTLPTYWTLQHTLNTRHTCYTLNTAYLLYTVPCTSHISLGIFCMLLRISNVNNSAPTSSHPCPNFGPPKIEQESPPACAEECPKVHQSATACAQEWRPAPQKVAWLGCHTAFPAWL